MDEDDWLDRYWESQWEIPEPDEGPGVFLPATEDDPYF